ncbi:MAG: hypothetical protein AAF654_03300 [Myxococcota bacterium]
MRILSLPGCPRRLFVVYFASEKSSELIEAIVDPVVGSMKTVRGGLN